VYCEELDFTETSLIECCTRHFRIIYCLCLLVALKTEEEDNSYTKA